MHAPSKTGTRSRYYPAFDYLRITLALVVAAGHSGFEFWDNHGNYAVQIFFALSGWLIGGILIDSRPADLPKFYFHRAARIWVPYAIAIALLMIASLLKERVTTKWLEIFFYDVTFVYNFFGPPQLAQFKDQMPLAGSGNQFWSICAEEQFYLLAPFLITLLPFGRKIWFWTVLAIAMMIVPNGGYFVSISIGVLAAVTARHVDVARFRPIFIVAGIALGVMTITELIPYRFGAPLSAIAIVLAAAFHGTPSQVGTILGGISLPLYLNQSLGVFVANAIFVRFGLRDSVVSHAAALLFSVLIATALYFSVDLVVRNNRDRFFSRRAGIALACVGFALVTTGLIGAQFF